LEEFSTGSGAVTEVPPFQRKGIEEKAPAGGKISQTMKFLLAIEFSPRAF
jgi:hypothetical protein